MQDWKTPRSTWVMARPNTAMPWKIIQGEMGRTGNGSAHFFSKAGNSLDYRPRHFVKKYAIFMDKSNTLIIHQVACYWFLVKIRHACHYEARAGRYSIIFIKKIDLSATKPADKSAGFVMKRRYCFDQQPATRNEQPLSWISNLSCNTLSFKGLASFFSNKLRCLDYILALIETILYLVTYFFFKLEISCRLLFIELFMLRVIEVIDDQNTAEV